jgi:outer membrane autotransporter protein
MKKQKIREKMWTTKGIITAICVSVAMLFTQSVYAQATTVINNGLTLSVDGVEIGEAGGSLGNVTFDENENSKLLIYGNTKKNFHFDGGYNIGRLVAGQVEQVVNKSAFTKWGVTEEGYIVSFGMRDQVFANDNYLAATQFHNKYTGWKATRDHLISGGSRVQYGYGYYGQTPCECIITCTTSCKPKKHRGAWVNYVGRDFHYRSSYNNNDWHLSTNGVQIGTDIFRTYRGQFGAFFGYEDSMGRNSTFDNFTDRLKANDYYVGLYGVHVFAGGSDLRTIFNFGWQDYKSDRHDLGDLLQTKFNGNTVELNVEWGKRHYFGGYYGMWSTRPAIAIDWYLNRLGGGRENFINTNALQYHSMNFSQLFFRFGTDLRYEAGRWALEGGMFYSYDMRGADLWSRVSDVETNEFHSALVGSTMGRSVLSLNVGGSYLVGKNFTLFAGYRGEAAPEQAGRGFENTGYVGGAWRW